MVGVGGGGLPLTQPQWMGVGPFPHIPEVLACPFSPRSCLKEGHFSQCIVWGSLLPQVCPFSCPHTGQKEGA